MPLPTREGTETGKRRKKKRGAYNVPSALYNPNYSSGGNPYDFGGQGYPFSGGPPVHDQGYPFSSGNPTSGAGIPSFADLLPSLAGLFGGAGKTASDSLPPQEVVPGHQFTPAGGQGGPGGLNPIQAALAQLDALINSGVPLPGAPSEADLQQSLNEAASGIRNQYNAQIHSIQHQNQGARQDTAAGSAEIQRLYKSLAKSYNKAGKRETRQGNRLSEQLQGMGERAQGDITTQAQSLNDAALKGAAGLGLADLGAQLTNQTNATAQELGNRAVARGQTGAQTAANIAGNNRTFMNTSGQASRLEGVNRSADLYAQLQDYIQANRDQIAGLVGQRQAAVGAAKAGIQNDFASAQQDYYDMAQQAQQDQISNSMDLLKLAMAAQAQQYDHRHTQFQDRLDAQQLGSGGESFYKMLPSQVAGPAQLLSAYGDPTVSDLYSQLSGRGSMQRGYTGNREAHTDQSLQGNYANMQDWVNDALPQGQWGALTTAQRNALVSALLLQLQGMAG